MPDGLDAPIAQGGTNVSGGQRQRLAIARALVQRPGDLPVRRLVLGARLRHRRRAARPRSARATADATWSSWRSGCRTIRDADRIIVLDDGRVVGTGTHAELMERQPDLPRDRRSPSSPSRRRHEQPPAGPASTPGAPAATPRAEARPSASPGSGPGRGPFGGRHDRSEGAATSGRHAAPARPCCGRSGSSVVAVVALAVLVVALTVVGPRILGTPPTSSSPASSAGSCPAASPRSRRSSGCAPRATTRSPTCSRPWTSSPARASTSPRSASVLLLVLGVYVGVGARRAAGACSTTSCSAPCAGCASTSRRS